MMKLARLLAVICIFAHAGMAGPPAEVLQKEYTSWTLEEAVGILNDSPWARQQTATRVVEGIGSGVFGEKEIFNRYYVRLLSALPIRQAYTRVDQILSGKAAAGGTDNNVPEQQSMAAAEGFDDRWIVLAVSFRSNDPELEQEFRRTLQAQTTDTLKTRAYLSTARFRQVRLAAFYPASEDGVGAKFVFPRQVGESPIVGPEDSEMVFEFEPPDHDLPGVRTTFSIKKMIIDGKVVL